MPRRSRVKPFSRRTKRTNGRDFNNDPGTRNSPQMPSLDKVHRMKQAFEELGHCPTWCSIIAALLSVVECKEGTYWPVGFICSVGEPEDTKVLFIGDSHPRMNFLIVNGLGQLPDAYLISATAYNEKVLLGDALPFVEKFWPNRAHHTIGTCLVEQRDDQWVTDFGIYHCTQVSCHACLLAKIGQFCCCPWHGASDPKLFYHVFCIIEPVSSVVKVIGYLNQQAAACNFVVLHICEDTQVDDLGENFCPLVTPRIYATSTLSEKAIPQERLSEIAAPLNDVSLPIVMYKHFFLQVGGPWSSLHEWLHSRSPA